MRTDPEAKQFEPFISASFRRDMLGDLDKAPLTALNDRIKAAISRSDLGGIKKDGKDGALEGSIGFGGIAADDDTGKESSDDTGKESSDDTGKESSDDTGKESSDDTGKESSDKGKDSSDGTGKESSDKGKDGSDDKEQSDGGTDPFSLVGLPAELELTTISQIDALQGERVTNLLKSRGAVI